MFGEIPTQSAYHSFACQYMIVNLFFHTSVLEWDFFFLTAQFLIIASFYLC